MKLSACFLPPGVSPFATSLVEVSGVGLELPLWTPETLKRALEKVVASREAKLARRPLSSLLSSLGQAVAVWLDPASAERREAEALLPALTGFSPQMVRHTLPFLFEPYRRECLEEHLREELGDPGFLDRFLPYRGGKKKALGPQLVVLVVAGNIPGVGLEGMVGALLAKSAVLVKMSSREPFLLASFAHTLARIDKEVGECLLVTPWKGGEEGLEEVAFSQADVVLAYGEEESLKAVRRRVSGYFWGYGPKVSFGLVGREVLDHAEVLARRAAYDIALFDQQGCLSPQLFYVERGGCMSPKGFARLLAQALEEMQKLLPRGRISLEESLAIRRLRDEAEWQALSGKPVKLYASSGGTGWTVLYEEDPAFGPSPLNRTVRVKPVDRLEEVVRWLGPWRPYLEAAAVAVAGERLLGVAEILGEAGVSRICSLGTLQRPSLSWRHGGHSCLQHLLRWVGLEEPQEGYEMGREEDAG